jgi:hypothetical protein
MGEGADGLVSANTTYKAQIQDGKFCVSNTGGNLWCLPNAGKHINNGNFGDDGNFCLADDTTHAWCAYSESTATAAPGSVAELMNNGCFCVLDATGNRVWCGERDDGVSCMTTL